MPISAQRPCGHPGCDALVRSVSRCDLHKSVERKAFDKYRGSAASRGYGHRWRKSREGFLKKHPFCSHCEKNGLDRKATIVDHIIPHKNDKSAFWDRKNWQPLCKSCHDIKTAREDGGFGRHGGAQKSATNFF